MNYNNNAVLMNALWLENIFCTLQAPIHHEQLERSGWYRNASTRFSLPFFQLPTVSLIETYSVEKLSLFVSFLILFLARLFHLKYVFPFVVEILIKSRFIVYIHRGHLMILAYLVQFLLPWNYAQRNVDSNRLLTHQLIVTRRHFWEVLTTRKHAIIVNELTN